MTSRERKLRLNAIQSRILWELKEAGEEDICCIANTLLSDAACADKASFISEILTELISLARLNLVAFYRYDLVPNGSEGLFADGLPEAVLTVADNFTWNPDNNVFFWRPARSDLEFRLSVVLRNSKY